MPQHPEVIARLWLVFASGSGPGFRTERSHGHERRERPVDQRPGRTARRGGIERRTSAGHDPLKAERGCLLAVQISARCISFLLTDLNGIELETRKLSLVGCSTTSSAICGYIEKELKLLLRQQEKTRDQLLAIVVGVPAITNVEEGSVLAISTLEGWRSVPLRAMLSKATHCTVILENDMNLAAQGEAVLRHGTVREGFRVDRHWGKCGRRYFFWTAESITDRNGRAEKSAICDCRVPRADNRPSMSSASWKWY